MPKETHFAACVVFFLKGFFFFILKCHAVIAGLEDVLEAPKILDLPRYGEV